MGSRGRHPVHGLTGAAAIACGLSGVAAQAQDAGIGQYGPSLLPLPDAAVGLTISRVDVRLAASSGDRTRDAVALRAARAATGALVGREYRPVLVDAALGHLVTDGTLRAATHRPAYEGARDALGIVVTLDLAPAPLPEAREAAPGFPVIHQDDRSKLTFILNTGVGVYSDSNAWFGAPALFNGSNPLAGELPGSGSTWAEAYLEFGIGGATRLGETDYYLFGAASGLFSASRGQDIFRDDGRDFLHPDKGYVGLLYADPDSGNSAQLSFGRQTWTLNDGFLISMVAGSSNAGERGATYLGPRNTTDFSAIFTREFGRARVALFYIDPDELEDLESNTTFAGANFGYEFTDAFSADASVITIHTSDSTYRTPGGDTLAREGTTTWGLHGLYRPTTPDHFWLEGEAYYQTNDDFAMSARAYYGTIGHIWKSVRWSPSISYRFASFSGDDPDTDSFERFDSMMSTGLGNWLQGVSFGKVYRNANLNTHRIQANLSPREGMNLTLTWHRLRADEINNIGGNPALSTLTSRDLGEEYTATLRWALDRNRYLQIVASHALPGKALKTIGADDPWTTLQASLYISF
ncbi:alginate export family protein [Rhodovulum strictum]|uniref:alginate export family protein n=1 Tax=Rhodovulum strictum TaxID=58314 RepID=UPI001B8723B9